MGSYRKKELQEDPERTESNISVGSHFGSWLRHMFVKLGSSRLNRASISCTPSNLSHVLS